MRLPRWHLSPPVARNSAWFQPTPAPRMKRLLDRYCSVESSLASTTGWRVGSTSTDVPSRTRSVAPAATASVDSGSRNEAE